MLSTLFSDRLLRDEFFLDLGRWLPRQRWYADCASEDVTLQVSGWVRLGDTEDRTTTLVTVEAVDGHRFAVPVTWAYEDSGVEGPAGARISTLDVHGRRVVIWDATAVDEARRVLVRSLLGGDLAGEGITTEARVSVAAADRVREDIDSIVNTERLTGEQSNTSIIVTCASGAQYIMKLFRHLDEGANPDIELHTALQGAGSARIADYCGAVSLRDTVGHSDLALVTRYLPGVSDAWRVAVVAASEGRSFAEEAQELGTALAEVHSDLASSLPVSPATSDMVTLAVESMWQRLTSFAESTPQLEPFVKRIHAKYRVALRQPWPAFQRIHGDLHLGQVLHSPTQGWVFLDFEGEPLRPIAERAQASSPLRDVAGILRSIDYAAGFVAMNDGVDAHEWARSAREAFLAAYCASATLELAPASLGAGPMQGRVPLELVKVFEIDKAAYEVAYEASSRPDWVQIPLRALERLLGEE